MADLYHTYKEYSRIQEELSITEEGVFGKDEHPTDYAGPILNVFVVHIIHMVNSAGQFQTMEFHNPPPLSKDKSTKVGAITIDGTAPVPPALGSGAGNGGTARKWVTLLSSTIPSTVKSVADQTWAIRSGDASAPT